MKLYLYITNAESYLDDPSDSGFIAHPDGEMGEYGNWVLVGTTEFDTSRIDNEALRAKALAGIEEEESQTRANLVGFEQRKQNLLAIEHLKET